MAENLKLIATSYQLALIVGVYIIKYYHVTNRRAYYLDYYRSRKFYQIRKSSGRYFFEIMKIRVNIVPTLLKINQVQRVFRRDVWRVWHTRLKFVNNGYLRSRRCTSTNKWIERNKKNIETMWKFTFRQLCFYVIYENVDRCTIGGKVDKRIYC